SVAEGRARPPARDAQKLPVVARPRGCHGTEGRSALYCLPHSVRNSRRPPSPQAIFRVTLHAALRLVGNHDGRLEEEPMRWRVRAVGLAGTGALAALLVVLLGSPSSARAADCGGNVPCHCGDTVNRSTTLTADLGVCSGLGLRLRSGIVLNCANHTI